MGYLTSLDTFFLVAFGHIFTAFIYCSIKHGYIVSINDICRNNAAHAALLKRKSVGSTATEADAAEPLPPAIPGLISWARASKSLHAPTQRATQPATLYPKPR